jgi:hypothetical protein
VLTIEDRPYDVDCSPEERAAIAGRVSVPADHIVMLHELPVQTVYTVGLMGDRLAELTRDWKAFGFLLDLTEARRPGAEVRAALRRQGGVVRDGAQHVAIVVGNNVVIRAMARLVGHALGYRSMSLHATRGEAIAELHRVCGEL